MPDNSVVEFKYDPFGRRLEKAVNGIATRYFYDNEDILFEYDSTEQSAIAISTAPASTNRWR